MNPFKNTQKQKFLAQIVVTSIEDSKNDLSLRCKFNFSYFTVQSAGQDFSDWSLDQLVKLLNKLKDYGRESLNHWRSQPCKSGTVLAVYKKFPSNSEFKNPDHIPHQAEWARFRLESGVRLVGFMLPPEFDSTTHSETGKRFDCNTFYIVFLDLNHLFYKTELK